MANYCRFTVVMRLFKRIDVQMMAEHMPKHVGNNAVNRRRKVCYNPIAYRQDAVRQRTASSVHVPCRRKALRHSVLPHGKLCACAVLQKVATALGSSAR